MAKIVDITDKLSFDGNPRMIIRGRELEVRSDAPTMLKVMSLISQNPGAKEIMETYELIFSEHDREKIDGLGLSFDDFVVVVMSAIDLITGGGNEGEDQTRTTTYLRTGI